MRSVNLLLTLDFPYSICQSFRGRVVYLDTSFCAFKREIFLEVLRRKMYGLIQTTMQCELMIMSPSFLTRALWLKSLPLLRIDSINMHSVPTEYNILSLVQWIHQEQKQNKTNNQEDTQGPQAQWTQILVYSSLEQVLGKDYNWDQTGACKRRVLKCSRARKSENWMSHDQPNKEWARGECEMTEEKVSVIA